MNNSIHLQKNLIRFGIPVVIITLMVFLSQSSLFIENPDYLSIGITIDLLLTVPLVYFLLIRKTSIPKTTVVPFLIIGIVVGSFILPKEQQHYLSLFKTYALPIIELLILGYVIYNVRKGIKAYKQNKSASSDFFTTLIETCNSLLPKPLVIPVVTEIAVFYYGFILWKKRKLKPNEFSYHKNSGTLTLLVALILIIAIETVTLHYLLMKWSSIAAWILTALSVYSGIQIFGFLRSMTKRPFIIGQDILFLRYGIMNETAIPFEDILEVNHTTKEIELNAATRKLSFLKDLESHNVIITLRTKNTLRGLYGIKKSYSTLALFVDDVAAFKTQIDAKLSIEQD